ncbi:MAG TPA: type III secretion system chaperone [Chlamydiales bacterium]|nr:type III secretion system chaperone [Chlamydiales bacterium]
MNVEVVVMLKQLVKDLAAEFELTLPAEVKGTYTFEVAPTVIVTFIELQPGVLIDAKIEECPKEKREDLFISIMQANMLGQGTGGSSIGLDKDEKYLTLSLALPYEINYRAFKESLEEFVNYLLYWRTQIQKAKEEAQRLI